MAKRDREEAEAAASDSDIDVSSSEDEELKAESDAEMEDVVNVDFDFFNLNPDVDFHATKNFLRQMLQDDSVDFGLSEMADLVLKLGNVGTTIKTEGLQSDPFSILSVIGLEGDNKQVELLKGYFLAKSKANAKLHAKLSALLAPSAEKRTAMVFSQRLVNMPVETMPVMYKLFVDELSAAGKDFDYDYFLVPSRVSQILASTVDQEFEDDAEHKRRKPTKGAQGPVYEYVHYEDEALEACAFAHVYSEYTHKNVEADGRRVFNDYAVDPKLSLTLLTKDQLAKAVQKMAEMFPYGA